MWIDSHCHLNSEQLKPLGGPDAVIKAARHAGVEGMLSICSRISDEFPEILAIAEAHPGLVWCTVGTHPHEASLESEKNIKISDIVNIANTSSQVIGIGETGLDYYYSHSTPEDQATSFRKNLAACRETGLPVIVHARDADEDVIRILREESAGAAFSGVLHCFSSSRWMAEQALEMGFYISFSGMITFKKSIELREIARDIPLERILIETDSPYLAPEPYRGKTNQPAYVGHTGKMLADIKSVSEDIIASHSKENFFSLFTKARGSHDRA